MDIGKGGLRDQGLAIGVQGGVDVAAEEQEIGEIADGGARSGRARWRGGGFDGVIESAGFFQDAGEIVVAFSDGGFGGDAWRIALRARSIWPASLRALAMLLSAT